ncbi:hypothetical protein DPMN_148105 [Dreissena polymorpha]|uniref:Uncharacterized protein n=1 Tax=Dreissena polymorpha TaxID=45954 RepID=A0A9D4J3M5_DREPO|nr:hypothetical protein DPMN_148105 [Dreissena polymorpha]
MNKSSKGRELQVLVILLFCLCEGVLDENQGVTFQTLGNVGHNAAPAVVGDTVQTPGSDGSSAAPTDIADDADNSSAIAALLNSDLLSGYNPNILPKYNKSNEVSIKITLININNFDELSGQLELTVMCDLRWSDSRLSFDSSKYGGIHSILLPVSDVWFPVLYIIQAYEAIMRIGTNSAFVRIDSNGTVTWTFGDVFNILCTVDVKYFPFDKQSCTVSILAWYYRREEMSLYAQSSQLINEEFTSESAQWDINVDESTVYNKTRDSTGPPEVQFNLSITRRHGFYIVYIIVPVMLLSIINTLVFLMPVTCGERMSVSVTVCLSFVIFMDTINNNVPESSSPMAEIYKYVLSLLVQSAITIFLCVISLVLFSCKGDVPFCVQGVVKTLRFKYSSSSRCCKRKVVVMRVTPDIKYATDMLKCNDNISKVDAFGESVDDIIDWEYVSRTFDIYAGVIVLSLFVTLSVYTFVTICIS